MEIFRTIFQTARTLYLLWASGHYSQRGAHSWLGDTSRFWFGIWYFSLYTVALFRQGEPLSALSVAWRILASIIVLVDSY